jgi:hypothetical protein
MKTIAYKPEPQVTFRRNVKYIAVLRTTKVTYWDSMTFGHEARPVGFWVVAQNCETKTTAEAKAQELKWHLENGFQEAIGYNSSYKVDAKDLEVVILRLERE